MKVGDLVMLSAHGSSLDMMRHRKNKLGLVIECDPERTVTKYKYRIRWLSSDKPTDPFVYHRRDLKFATPTPHSSRYDKDRGSGS